MTMDVQNHSSNTRSERVIHTRLHPSGCRHTKTHQAAAGVHFCKNHIQSGHDLVVSCTVTWLHMFVTALRNLIITDLEQELEIDECNYISQPSNCVILSLPFS